MIGTNLLFAENNIAEHAVAFTYYWITAVHYFKITINFSNINKLFVLISIFIPET